MIRKKSVEAEVTQLILPLHPNSQAVKAWLTMPYDVDLKAWNAAMIKILDPRNAAIAAYCKEVQQKKRQPGLPIYPPMIEMAE